MSFWNIWSRSKEAKKEVMLVAEPARYGVVTVLSAGKWEIHVFFAGSVKLVDGHLMFASATRGQCMFAPGIWSTVQTFPLSEECQQLIREYVKTQNFDYMVEEKLRKSDL